MREHLERLARRARLVAAREGFLDSFFWTSYAAASLLVADRIRLEFAPGGRVLSDGKGAAVLIGAALAASAAGALVRALRTRPAAADLARATDRSLGLHDRVATALEGAPGALAPLVRREAERDLASAPAVRILPSPPAGRRRWALAAVIGALLVALFPPPPGAGTAAERSIRERRPRSGADVATPGAGAGGRGSGSGGEGEDEEHAATGGRTGRGRPSPPPPLTGDPERTKFRERPAHVAPLVGEGAWKPSRGLGVDSGAAAAGAPGAATDPERLQTYRRQAEAFVGRDGFPPADRALVQGYFDRVAPGR